MQLLTGFSACGRVNLLPLLTPFVTGFRALAVLIILSFLVELFFSCFSSTRSSTSRLRCRWTASLVLAFLEGRKLILLVFLVMETDP